MKIRSLKKRRAAGSRLYRTCRDWANAEHGRLEALSIARLAAQLNEYYPPPAPAPDAWWYDFAAQKMMVYDADTNGWREAD